MGETHVHSLPISWQLLESQSPFVPQTCPSGHVGEHDAGSQRLLELHTCDAQSVGAPHGAPGVQPLVSTQPVASRHVWVFVESQFFEPQSPESPHRLPFGQFGKQAACPQVPDAVQTPDAQSVEDPQGPLNGQSGAQLAGLQVPSGPQFDE